MKDMNIVNVFMLPKDEDLFLSKIKEKINLEVIDVKPSTQKYLKGPNDSTEYIALVNKEIISLNLYRSMINEVSGYYHFPQIGNGIIQYNRSKIDAQDCNCLQSGSISWSFDTEEGQKFAQVIFSAIKKMGQKVYACSRNRTIPIIADKTEKNIYSFPIATKVYNGINGKYLTLNSHAFIVKN